MNANDLLEISDLRQKTIHVEKWGKDVLIQELGLLPLMEVYQSMDLKDLEEGKAQVKPLDIAKIVALGVINADGTPVFSSEHIPALAKKSREALLFIYSEIMSLSGTEDDAGKN
jgi:hypothetical protein